MTIGRDLTLVIRGKNSLFCVFVICAYLTWPVFWVEYNMGGAYVCVFVSTAEAAREAALQSSSTTSTSSSSSAQFHLDYSVPHSTLPRHQHPHSHTNDSRIMIQQQYAEEEEGKGWSTLGIGKGWSTLGIGKGWSTLGIGKGCSTLGIGKGWSTLGIGKGGQTLGIGKGWSNTWHCSIKVLLYIIPQCSNEPILYSCCSNCSGR